MPPSTTTVSWLQLSLLWGGGEIMRAVAKYWQNTRKWMCEVCEVSSWTSTESEYHRKPNHECIRFKKWARTITEGNTPKFSKKLKIPEHFRAQCVFSYSRFSVRWKKAPNYLKIGTENFIYLVLMFCHFWWEGLYLTLLTPVALTYTSIFAFLRDNELSPPELKSFILKAVKMKASIL